MRYDTISHELFDETYIEVRRRKKQRKKTSFKNDFFTYLIDKDFRDLL